MARYKAQNFIDAMPGSGGIISTVAKRLGCDWHTVKKYVTRHPTVQAAYDAERERVTDMAEAVIIESITEKDVQTAKWYLTMKGGDRGYVQKQQQDITHSGEMEFNISDWKAQRRERLSKAEQGEPTD